MYAVWQVILRHEARIGWTSTRNYPLKRVKIALVLFLSFLIGLEREEHKAANGAYSFGGVRTFPLIGLDRLFHRFNFRHATAAVHHRLSGHRRISAFVLLAQAHLYGHGLPA